MNKKLMIREAIKKRIKELGITQKKMSEDLGFSEGNFSNFLKGNRTFPLPLLESICEYLDLELKTKQGSDTLNRTL